MIIICNGKERDVTPYERLTYDELVTLAWGPQLSDNRVFTVTYHQKGGSGGNLTDGESVQLSEGMVFNCVRTNNA